ncbi:hypothetical protein FOZ61_003865, partial [Perkinsus olseni]
MIVAESLSDLQAQQLRVKELGAELVEWYEQCSLLFDKVISPAHTFFTKPEKLTVILRRWCNSDRYAPVRPWEESSQMGRKFFNSLITEHKLTIGWHSRRVLLADMVKATPRFSGSDRGTALDLTGRLFLQELKSCENEEQFQQKLIKTAQDLGHRSIDELLQISSR